MLRGRVAGKFEEALPVAVRVQDADVPVERLVRLALWHTQARKSGTAERRIEGRWAKVFDEVEDNGGFEHGHLHRLATTTLLAVQQRGEDAGKHRLSSEFVADAMMRISGLADSSR